MSSLLGLIKKYRAIVPSNNTWLTMRGADDPNIYGVIMTVDDWGHLRDLFWKAEDNLGTENIPTFKLEYDQLIKIWDLVERYAKMASFL